MPRSIRIQAPDVIYHAASRGAEKRMIFDVIRGDRERFLDLLAYVVREYEWILHAYCLMGTHFHLVLETPHANISAGMQYLKGQYARWFNACYPEREGVLFERRFWADLVLEESHVYELARYVVLNPVRAGLVRSPERWAWSSYAATVGLERTPAFLRPDAVLKFFGEGAAARVNFARFVGEGMAHPLEVERAVQAMSSGLTPVLRVA